MPHAPDKGQHLQVWATPHRFFRGLNQAFRFTLDVCACEWSAKCERFYTEELDAFTQPWGPNERIFCNPPYNELDGPSPWFERGYQAAKDEDSTVVYLIPASTDTQWWHNFAWRGDVGFVCGRLQFEPGPGYEGNVNGTNFASAIVVYSPDIVNGGQAPGVFVLGRDGVVRDTTRRLLQQQLVL